MKKIMALVLMAALMAMPVSPAVALADTTTENSTAESSVLATTTGDDEASVNEEAEIVDLDGKEVKAGTLPDSPLFWLDELVEKLQVALTFNPEKKVKLMEKHACERIAEMIALAKKADAEKVSDESTEDTESTDTDESVVDTEQSESSEENTDGTDDQASDDESKNVEEDASEDKVEQDVVDPKVEKKFKAYKKALKGYDAKIARAQEFLSKIEDTNSEEYKKLQEALLKVNANNVLVLGSLLEKLPPQASQRLAVNIVRSMEKAVAKMEKMEEKNKSLADEENTQEGDSQEESTEDLGEDTIVDETGTINSNPADSAKVSAPVPAETVVPVAPVPNAVKKDVKHKDKLTKAEYKELAKEAKSALKQFKRDLGLIGPDKEKVKDNKDNKDKNKKITPQPQKVKDQSKNYNANVKYSDKSFLDKKEVHKYEKDNKGKKDHGRDDDRGKGKDNRDRN